MFKIKFVFKGVSCELADTFNDLAAVRAVADKYLALPGVSGVTYWRADA